MNNPQPPKWAKRLFRWYCRPDRYEELAGDLEEIYERREQAGPRWQADLYFWWLVVRCFRSYARKTGYTIETSGALYTSYLKLAARQMYANKGTMAINIVGLGFALAFCIVTYLFYGYNREFDTHFNSEDIFRVHAIREAEGVNNRFELTPLVLEDALKNDHSGVKEVASYLLANIDIGKEQYFFSGNMAFVSGGFLDVFDIPIEEGSKQNFPHHGIYLTRSYAKKLFGENPAIGKTLSVFYFGRKMNDVEVVGVVSDPPVNSSFAYDALFNLESLANFFELPRSTWETKGFQFGQYVQLTSVDQKEAVEAHMRGYVPIHNLANESRKVSRFELVPYLNPDMTSNDFISYTATRISTEEFLIFVVVSMLILFIACFNLANTQIALIARRVKEIGIRKTMGSSGAQIFTQYIFEMFIIMTLAILLGLSFTNIISGQVFGLYGQRFLLQDLNLAGISTFVAIFLICVTLLTGLIPALYARRFQPVTIINHKHKLRGLSTVHYLLATSQYTFTIALLLCGLSFMQNASYLKNKDFGYNPNDLLVVRVRDAEEFQMFKNRIDQLAFSKETFGSLHYLSGYSLRSLLKIDEQEEEISHYIVGASYLTQMEVNFHSGRDFLADNQTDLSDHIIVNRQFADKYFAGEALHRQVWLNSEVKTIVGVVENYQDGELFSWYETLPLVFTAVDIDNFDFLFVRTNGAPHGEVLAEAEAAWRELNQRPMVYHWQEKYAYSGTVSSSNQLRNIFFWLTTIALILSIIGIMALASIQVDKRTKEISIRKVLGASFREVWLLINKPFFLILGVSLLLGVGVGHTLSEMILDSIFVSHQGLSLAGGLLTGVGVTVAALVVIVLAVYKPVNANPVNGLRAE